MVLLQSKPNYVNMKKKLPDYENMTNPEGDAVISQDDVSAIQYHSC